MNPIYRKHASPIRKLLLMKAVSGGVPLNEYTATGNPLTFNTNKAKPLKSLLIPWTPSQSGSGDPSPENVRPISGQSGVTVFHSGADTSNPDTINVTFPAGTGTVYGGELDLVSGVLTVECVKCVPTSVNNITKHTNDVYYWVISLNKSGLKRMYQGSDTSHYMSNVFYPRWGVTADLGNFYVISETTLVIAPTEEAQSIRVTTEAMQWINQVNPEFVIPLVTPLTYQLTPTQIQTLIGDNVIWSDTNGSNTAVYYKRE